MIHQSDHDSKIKRTVGGAIDYDFYNQRARRHRGMAMVGLLNKLFEDKKTSSQQQPGKVALRQPAS